MNIVIVVFWVSTTGLVSETSVLESVVSECQPQDWC